MIPLLIPVDCQSESDDLCATWCTERDRDVCYQIDPELNCLKSSDSDKIICSGGFLKLARSLHHYISDST